MSTVATLAIAQAAFTVGGKVASAFSANEVDTQSLIDDANRVSMAETHQVGKEIDLGRRTAEARQENLLEEITAGGRSSFMDIFKTGVLKWDFSIKALITLF